MGSIDRGDCLPVGKLTVHAINGRKIKINSSRREAQKKNTDLYRNTSWTKTVRLLFRMAALVCVFRARQTNRTGCCRNRGYRGKQRLAFIFPFHEVLCFSARIGLSNAKPVILLFQWSTCFRYESEIFRTSGILPENSIA